MASSPSPHQAQGPPADALLSHAFIQRLRLGVVIWRLKASADPASATLVAANPAASNVARIDFSVVIGRTLGDLFPDAVANGGRAYAEVAASGIERPLDAGVYPELGESVVSGSIVPLPESCVGVVFEIEADQRRLARERRKLNAFLDSIVDNIPAMVFVKDAEHLRYELFNLAGESLSGFSREEVYGKDDQQLFPKDVADFFQAKDREVLREGRMLDIPEEPLDTRAGRRWLHTKKIPLLGPDGTPQHLLGISLDITDRKLAVEALRRAHEELEIRVLERTSDLVKTNARLQCEIDERRRTEEALVQAEEQLRHSQKMEAIGKLAGGIAHDFNNLLSVIICYASILSAGLDPDSKLAQGLHEVKRAGERASDLTRQLLAFSRQQVLAPQVVDVNEVIGGMDKMLRRVIGEDLELRTTQAAGLGRIKADPGQLEQVIMNLVVNARDAMPDGGQLTIETDNVDLDETYARDHLDASPGSYVMLAVTDTGVGMDKGTQARIFEPFFTTKEQGKGTGLGLSTVFGIVKQSGGHIWAESEPNKGTTFRLYFARTDDPPASVPSEPSSTLSLGGLGGLRGTETILLVEDEEQVRTLANGILSSHGYRVLEAPTPSEALVISRQTRDRIELLITDVVMPEMNGRVLSERLRSERPDLEVLFMSGYTDKAIGRDGVLDPNIAFLQKPITPLSLTRTVRRILNSRARRSNR